MSDHDECKKQKQAAKKVGVDISVFKEDLGKEFDRKDISEVEYLKSRIEFIEHLVAVAKVADHYKRICYDLERETNDEDQCQALERMSKFLGHIEQGCTADSVILKKR